MHYHVLRVSYNTSSGKDLEPVDVGTALPTANRFLLHDWKTRACTEAH